LSGTAEAGGSYVRTNIRRSAIPCFTWRSSAPGGWLCSDAGDFDGRRDS